MTYIQTPVVHSYKVVKTTKSATVYELLNASGGLSSLTPQIRIEKDARKSNSRGLTHWLRLRDDSNWKRCELVTGLRPFANGMAYGDRKTSTGKRLMIFVLGEGTRRDRLQVHVYPFYPSHQLRREILSNFLQP